VVFPEDNERSGVGETGVLLEVDFELRVVHHEPIVSISHPRVYMDVCACIYA
jgi:hypothetical protein